MAGVMLTTGCGDDDPASSGPNSNQIYDSLLFIRERGAIMTTGPDWAICCGEWEPGVNEDNTLKIYVYDALGQEAGFKLFVLLDSVEENVDYSLPTEPAGDAPVSLFINDVSDPSLAVENHCRSSVTGSTGTIVVNSFSCGPPVTLDVSIEASIVSETFGSPPVTVSGRFICEIYENPATFGCDFGF
jgi:hypothetical protein